MTLTIPEIIAYPKGRGIVYSRISSLTDAEIAQEMRSAGHSPIDMMIASHEGSFVEIP